MQRRGERVRIMSREIGSYTKSIEQTEYDVSTSSKLTSTTQETRNLRKCNQRIFCFHPKHPVSIFFYFCIENRLFLLLPPWIIMLSVSSDNPKTSSNMDTTSMYMMTDIKIFINLVQLVGQYPQCQMLLPQL